MITQTMDRLGKALDRESYEWLASHAADILEAVEAEVAAGRKPEEIRLFVIRATGREDLAKRCEQGARHVKALTVER